MWKCRSCGAHTESYRDSCAVCREYGYDYIGNELSDQVNSPAHYNAGAIECIDAIKAATGEKFCGYLQGNAIKYLYRYERKNHPVQDLKKAIWYINKLIEEIENG